MRRLFTLLIAILLVGTTAYAGDECVPEDLTVVLDTGWDEEAGSVIPAGNDDDDWIITADAGGGTTGIFAPVVPGVGAWQTIPNTMWLSADWPWGPNGFYTYETCWCLHDDYTIPSLSLFIRADDDATVFVNSCNVLSLPDGTFNDPSPTGISVAPSCFQPGQNCVTVVTEQKYGGPHGFNLQGTFTAETAKCCECTDPPPDLEAWWPLDETAGPIAADIFINAHDGFWSGGPGVTLGQYVNNSMLLDGVDDYVRVPNDPGLNFGPSDDLTIDAWVRTTSNVRMAIVNKKDAFPTDPGYQFIVGGGQLAFEMGDGSSFAGCGSTTLINDGDWHFVAVTLDRSSTTGIQLYIDGVPDGAPCDPTSVGNLTNSRNFHIGGDPLHPNGIWWDGNLDEIELFRRALTPAEIFDLYAAGNQGKCPPVPCQDSTGLPVCEGVCPDGSICVEGPAGGPPCDCIPEVVLCEESEFPVCDGDCPPGQTCQQGLANDCGCQDLVPDDCETSPYPECNGVCDGGGTCQANPVGDCECIPPTTCEDSFYPTCSGDCPPGETCVTGPNQDCVCEPELHCGDMGDYPTCGGNCPPGFVCEIDTVAQICVCVEEFPSCANTFYPVCDGDCPPGETCENVFGTDNCACEPEPEVCGDPLFPQCDGACPDNQKCRERQDGIDGCECVTCDVIGTGGLGGILVDWPVGSDKDKLRWTGAEECALFYNSYRLTAPLLTDADNDGLADVYGSCYVPEIIANEVQDASKPPPGETHWYLVTGENSTVEGPLGRNSAGVERPNTLHCP